MANGNSLDVEKVLFNAMMSRETKITIQGVELTWKLIEGTVKERERASRKKAKEFAQLLED